MAKKAMNSQQSNKGTRKTPVSVSKPRPENRAVQQAGWWSQAFGIRSLAIGVASIFLLYVGISMNEGYKWMWSGLLKGNWKHIQAHRNASLEERYTMKLGFDYSYLNYIKKNTPEDAIILFPLSEHIVEAVGNQKLSGYVAGKKWATHFIYPRRILYQNEKDTNPLYNQVTHVAITAGHGYEYLEYEVYDRPAFAVFPKRKINP